MIYASLCGDFIHARISHKSIELYPNTFHHQLCCREDQDQAFQKDILDLSVRHHRFWPLHYPGYCQHYPPILSRHVPLEPTTPVARFLYLQFPADWPIPIIHFIRRFGSGAIEHSTGTYSAFSHKTSVGPRGNIHLLRDSTSILTVQTAFSIQKVSNGAEPGLRTRLGYLDPKMRQLQSRKTN